VSASRTEEFGGAALKCRWIKFLFLVFLGSASLAQAATLNSYLRNRDGIKKFEEKSYFPSYQEFMKALEDDPLNPELHLNIARALEANEEFEKAEQAYRGALKILPKDSTRRFETLFNLAGVQAKNKKIELALDTYQLALEMDPDSVEVKTNIELLWQGGGEGEGDGEQSQDPKDQKGKGEGEQEDQKTPPKKEKPQPKPFSSKELSPQDVKKILDEIKNQEQGIRADENDKGAKQAQPEKDW
jgi:Ca-activated chloride channel family protein